MCGLPKLIAACHVLHRLSLPRHPPCALSSLTIELTPAQGATSLRSCREVTYSPPLECEQDCSRNPSSHLLKTLFLLNTYPSRDLAAGRSLERLGLCSALYSKHIWNLAPPGAPHGRPVSKPNALPNLSRCQTSTPSLFREDPALRPLKPARVAVERSSLLPD